MAHVLPWEASWWQSGVGKQDGQTLQPGLSSRVLLFASCVAWAGFSTSLSLKLLA